MQIGAMNHPARNPLEEIGWFGRHGFVPWGGETFPLACSPQELDEFIEGLQKHAAGWIGFYGGKPPEELRRSKTISDALTLGWLELFEKKAKALEK